MMKVELGKVRYAWPYSVKDREYNGEKETVAEGAKGEAVRNTQITYMWETSIPASWKKIKGERHFQRHITTLRVASSSLPSKKPC